MNEKQPPANGERQDPSKLADRLQEKLSRILTERPFEYAWWRQSALQERRIQTNPELSKDGETNATERTIFLTGRDGEPIAVFGVVHDSRPVVLGPTVAIMAPDGKDWVVYRSKSGRPKDGHDGQWQIERIHGSQADRSDQLDSEPYTFFQSVDEDGEQDMERAETDAQELKDVINLIEGAHCRIETPPKSKETEALLDQIKKLREEVAYRMNLLAEGLYPRR
jgi:hypothetical protein